MNSSFETYNVSSYCTISSSESDFTTGDVVDFEFVRNLPPVEAHRRAMEAGKLLGRAEKTLASWIVEINDRKLYQVFSCSSIYHYASHYLKLAGHTVAEFLRTGRKLAELPLLSAAYEKGELSSTHIREITRVATPETEGFWYETAKDCTTRKIEKLVAFTPKGGLPPVNHEGQRALFPGEATADKKDCSCSASAEREGICGQPDKTGICENASTSAASDPIECRPALLFARASSPAGIETQVKYHDKLVVELTGEEMAVIKGAFDKARKESRKKDRASLLVHIARVFLEGSSTNTTGRESTRPPYQVVFHHHLPSGISWSETAKGERPITPQDLEKALCDAEVIDISSNRAITGDPLRDIPHSLEIPQEPVELTRLESNENTEEGLEYVNELYGKMKRRKHGDCPGSKGPLRRVRARKTIPTALRKMVVERDGHCCQAPGCGSAHFTVLHHLDPMALGGTHEAHRLITLCWYCHDLVHKGRISVKGSAPDNLTWFFCGDSKPCDRGHGCGAPHKK